MRVSMSVGLPKTGADVGLSGVGDSAAVVAVPVLGGALPPLSPQPTRVAEDDTASMSTTGQPRRAEPDVPSRPMQGWWPCAVHLSRPPVERLVRRTRRCYA
jgi:hypothetical protein